MVLLADQYSPEGMIMRAQLANSATNYFTNIPNMSLYEITDDVGFAVVQFVEGALFSKGVGLAGKSFGAVTKVGSITSQSTNITRAIGAAPRGFSKFKSINQLNILAQTGKLTKTITRFDKGKIFGELDHVHFSNGSALNINGTWKHGSKILTNKEIKILTQNGWILPK